MSMFWYLLQEKVFILPVDHQPVQEALNHFIAWLSRAEEVAASHPPLKADLISLKEEEIAHTVCCTVVLKVIYQARGRVFNPISKTPRGG